VLARTEFAEFNGMVGRSKPVCITYSGCIRTMAITPFIRVFWNEVFEGRNTAGFPSVQVVR
jgi:hypothetical protein